MDTNKVESGWLIERPQHDGKPATWWGLEELDGVARPGFTSNANEAVRFARKRDAEWAMALILNDGKEYIATEHMWSD